MMRRNYLFYLIAMVFALSTSVHADGPGSISAYWKDGLRFKTSDGSFEGKIKGRLHNDWAGFLSDSDDIEAATGDSLDDGTEFRRARLGIEGTIFKRLEFEADYDFADGESEIKDAYVAFLNIPVAGTIFLGHFKEPVGLENLTSSNYVTFMERSLMNEFTPSRNSGIMVRNSWLEDHATFAVGVFKDTNSQGAGTGDGGYSLSLRGTAAPIIEQEGRQLVHLGVSYSRRDAEDDEVKFRSRPEVHLSPRFVDTGDFAADRVDILGVELAAVFDSFSAQAEFMNAFVDSEANSDPNFYGLYAQVSYFVTGEYRRYNRAKGSFKKIKPVSNFLSSDEGTGAVELALRYSRLDLSDEMILGGELQDFTFGVNWYLSSKVRMMLNYIYADLKDVDEVSIAQARMQIAF